MSIILANTRQSRKPLAIDGIPFITEAEEHTGQFATSRNANIYAKLETTRTGITHLVTPSLTWRNLEPRYCFHVYLHPGKSK
jgi:hypothetical protein